MGKPRKQKTSSAPGEGALAHEWLMQQALPPADAATLPAPKRKRRAKVEAASKPEVGKPKRARPIAFTQDLADEICERIALGELLVRICEGERMPDRRSVWRWCRTKPDFNKQYEEAGRWQARAWADDMLTIVDDDSNDVIKDAEGNASANHAVIARARLRFDARRFLMSKHYPALYGDHRTVDISVTATLANDLEKMRARVLAEDALLIEHNAHD